MSNPILLSGQNGFTLTPKLEIMKGPDSVDVQVLFFERSISFRVNDIIMVP